jgi:hypothetical protein
MKKQVAEAIENAKASLDQALPGSFQLRFSSDLMATARL